MKPLPPPEGPRRAPIAIILHPHPQFGGTMNNRVVYNLHYAFYELGFTVLRFNFRGVGGRRGNTTGIGELSDAASALDYLQSMNTNSKHCWVAGFSFGRLDRDATSHAPPRNHRLHLGPRRPRTCTISPSSRLPFIGSHHQWRSRPRGPACRYRVPREQMPRTEGHQDHHQVIEGAGHFFEDPHMDTMIGNVKDYVRRRLTETSR